MIEMSFISISEGVVVKIIRIATIIAGGILSRLVIKTLVNRLRKKIRRSSAESIQQARKRVETITSLLTNAANFVISLLVIFLILTEMGVDIAPLLAGAGILGLGIGLAMKDLASDLVAGFFILLENQINVGDMVQIGSSEGKVIKVSLRTIVLRDEEGKRHIIPNSSIKTIIKTVKN